MGNVIRVLLADDNAALREQLQALLTAEPDMDVVGVAGDGQMAVERAQSLRPDVVAMDLSMPVLNGLEATRQLRSSCPEIRIVALTSHQDPCIRSGGSASEVVSCQNAGFSAYCCYGRTTATSRTE